MPLILQAKALEQEQISQEYQEIANLNDKRQKHDGVVVTPYQVVDFQIKLCLATIKEKFKREPDDGIEWLDPFGGSGIFTARLLQIVDLSPHRKAKMAENCVVIEIDPQASQIASNNLARVLFEETGIKGSIHVVCADTFDLPPDINLWELPSVKPTIWDDEK